MKRFFICLAVLISIVGLLVACDKKATPDNETQTQSTESSEIVFYTTDEDCFAINTKYSVLEYPKKWEEFTKIEISEGDSYTVKFFRVTSAKKIHLFNLFFDKGSGYCLGTLKVDEKRIPIYLESFSLDQNNMSQDEYYYCCMMQDDVNVIISRLIEKTGFEISIDGSFTD